MKRFCPISTQLCFTYAHCYYQSSNRFFCKNILHTIFFSAESYQKQLLKKHALPVGDGIETSSSAAPTESSFRGILRRYNLKLGKNKMDLLQVMMQNKEEIDALILERVKEGPNKVQFHVEVEMNEVLTVQDGDTGNFERIRLFQNTNTLTVYFEGIAVDQYLELIEHLVNQVNSFSSHGSGWIIVRTVKINREIEMPMGLTDMDRFERLNKSQINVFWYAKCLPPQKFSSPIRTRFKFNVKTR